MAELHGKQLWSDKLGRSQQAEIRLYLERDASAGTFSIQNDVPAEVSAGAITQASIDALLGSSSEVDGDKFDATAQGTNALGFVIDCGGQVRKAISCIAYDYGTGAGDAFKQTDLTASTLAAGIEVSSSGNLAGRAIIAGMDANTSTDGLVEIRILVELK